MSRTIDVRGVRLSALIEGSDGPWVTFAHSLATDATLFDAQAQALAGRYRILRFDMRGHGGSAAPPRPYALADLVGDVAGLWDALGIERSHFVGLSIGGMTGFGVALAHPDRLVSLTACDCRADAPAFFRDSGTSARRSSPRRGSRASSRRRSRPGSPKRRRRRTRR